jgi:Sortase domain
MRLRAEWLAAALIVAVITAAGTDLALVLNRDVPHAAAAAPVAWEPPLPIRTAPRIAEPSPPVAPRPTPPAKTRLGANSVEIPVQHVVAPIVDYCPIIAGGLEPPADVHQVCYWAGGAGLGDAAGTSVLTGHINWVGQGTGAFGNLGALRRGDLVYTSDARRTVTAWRITRVEHRPKTLGINPDAFVGHRGPRRLYLISCGGAFDSAELSYVDNIYVLATPLPPAPPPTAPTPPGPPAARAVE